MDVISIALITTIGLCVVFVIIGLWFKKFVVSSEDFMLAGRKVPFWLMAAGYLGGFVGGSSVAGYVSLGYTDGISGMWTSLFVITGMVLFVIIFVRRLNAFGRKTGAVTMADFVCARYGEKLRLPVSIIGFLRPGVIIGMQFLAIAIVANIMFGIDMKVGVFIGAIVMLLYLVTAGQYSALVNQWLQSILQSLGILLFAIAAIKIIGNPGEAVDAMFKALPPEMMNLWKVDFSMFTVWLLTFGLFYFVDPWMYMWSYMAKSPRTSSNGMLAILGASYFNVLPFIAGIVLVAGAMLGRISIPDGLSGDALYAWFATSNMGLVSGVLVLSGLIMTIVSCASSFAMNGVTLLTRDIYNKVINKKATEKQLLVASRLSLIVVVVIGILCANWLPILVPLWSLGQAIVIAGLFACTMSAWFWKRSTTAGALASTIIGGLGAFGWACYAWIETGSPGSLMFGLHACHVGLALSIPVMIIVSLVTKPEYEKAEITSYKKLGEEIKIYTPEAEAITRPGLYGWLGADIKSWKIFWPCVFGVFILHYILAFAFHVPTATLIITWLGLIVSVFMILQLTIMGAKDAYYLVKEGKAEKAASSAS